MRAKRLAVLGLCVLSSCGGASAATRERSTVLQRPYDVAAEPSAVRGARDPSAFEAAIARAGRETGSELRGDGRLARLAERLASAPQASAEPIAEAARDLGLVDAGLALREVRSPDPELLAAAVQAELGTALRESAPTHYGLFVGSEGSTAWLALGRRPLRLEPVPKRVAVGTSVELRGRLAANATDLVLHADTEGTLLTLPGGEGPDFALRVPLTRAGAYRLVLDATVYGRPRAMAELVVLAGQAVPAARASGPPKRGRDPSRAAEELAARVHALRETHGLPRLRSDAALDAEAARSAAKLAAGAADTASTTVDEDGLRRASVRGADPDALWNALLADAGTRARLLWSEATHLGVGVRPARGAWIATVLLAMRPTVFDADLAAAQLLAAFDRHRGARGAGSLRPDPQLTRTAQRAAQEIAQHPERDVRDVVAAADVELEPLRLRYGRVSCVAAVVDQPLDAASLEPALDRAAEAAGIAVAQRSSGEGPRVIVVVALGWPR